MVMVGSLAGAGLVSRCLSLSSSKRSELRTVSVQCYRRGADFSDSFKFRSLRPVRISFRFSALLHYQLRVPSASSRGNYVLPEFEEREGNARWRTWKLLQLIVKALGVGIVAYSIIVLRAKLLSKKPPLSWPTLKTERVITGEFASKDAPQRHVDSRFVSGRKTSFSSMVEAQQQDASITQERNDCHTRAFTGSTNALCTYVMCAEDQDLLEIDEQAFEQWLVEVKEAAVKRGIQESVVIQALHGIRPSKRILVLDSNQPEVKLTLEAYLKNMINAYRVNKGVAGFQENELLLAEISAKYGVPSPVLVAIWGIESSYGGYSGNWDVLRALVTLAYASEQPRRAQFFKAELLQALQIIQEGHGPQSGEPLRGSWAGAMGQCQFMPSSFLAYAVDYDGDGRKDIWASRADMFASMANYLNKHGWQKGGLVAQKVQIPGNMDKNLLGLKVQKSVQEWTNKYKVRLDKGQPEISPDEMASLVAPDGPKGSAYLVFHNFRTIMRYNTSPLYSIAVWQLALQILDGLGSSAGQFPELVSILKC